VLLQVIRRVEGLREAGSHPAADLLSGERGHLVERFPDRAFLVLFFVQQALGVTVADELPAGAAHRSSERRVLLDHG
jgi:hypothetical protein